MGRPKKHKSGKKIKRYYLTYKFNDPELEFQNSQFSSSLNLAHAPEFSVFRDQFSNEITLSFRSEESMLEHVDEMCIEEKDIVYMGDVRPPSGQHVSKYDVERLSELMEKVKNIGEDEVGFI